VIRDQLANKDGLLAKLKQNLAREQQEMKYQADKNWWGDFTNWWRGSGQTTTLLKTLCRFEKEKKTVYYTR
jgi:protein subunit release factor B